MAPKRSRFEGVGGRISERITALGYKNVIKFSTAHGYLPSYVYDWVNDKKIPNPANLDRLAKDLGVTAAWLLFGGELPATIRRNRIPG